MNLKLNDRQKVMLLAVVLAGGGAAAWFLYLEEMVFGGPAQVATAPAPAPKPAAVPAAAPKPAPVAEAPKPASVAEAPKPAPAPVAEKPAPAPAPVAEKPAAKPAPMAEAPKPAPVAEAPKPAPVAEAPAPAPAVAEAPPMPREVVPMPVTLTVKTVAGPRFNDLVTAVLYRDSAAVDELLAFGKWADKPDTRGMTPLMLAALLGDTGIAAALVKAGADPQRSGPGGQTALSIARERKDAAMLGLLMEKR